ncbi:MAG: M48 family metallopeptidase [Gammaproteobacteria bacterium]|nr:M48 family metallopeptidase [Gammaproteobacteria bacterium]
MAINGELYDGKTSAHWPAQLNVYPGGLLQLRWGEEMADYPLTSVEVTSRLGNTPRYFTLPDGRKFETRDNDAVDTLLRVHSNNELHGWHSLLHRLESRMHYVVLALLVVVAFSWGMLKYGLPAAAEGIAYRLPQNIMQGVSDTTLAFLDEHYLEPSTLDAAVQQRLQGRFASMSSAVEQGFHYQLLFRHGGELLGANALALPSGTIVLTDELVAIANHDEELVAVLAHELGHVVHRHSLRQLLQNSALSLAITYITGDVSSLVAALPLLLVQMGYSRHFEYEADQFAYDFLRQHDIPVQRFATILQGLEVAHAARRTAHGKVQQEEDGTTVTAILEYLSTHPPTEERVRRFREASGDLLHIRNP